MTTYSSLQESINEINNKKVSSIEEEIILNINLARFKNKEFIEEIVSKIKENDNSSAKTITLKELNNKTIHYYEAEILESFLNYINENSKTFQFLEDFSFLVKLNEKFCNLFKNKIKAEKKIDLFSKDQKNNTLELLQNEIYSESYYGYYIENVSIKNINLLLLMIIFEEFITLKRKTQNKENEHSNIYIESDETVKIDTICFLTNNFSTILINLDQISEATNEKIYNIYLLLLSKDYFEKDLITQEEEKIQKTSPSAIKERYNHMPAKYDKIYIPNMQIPKSAINRLILSMDSDNDFKVTLQDIINFANKHYINFDKEFFEKLFLEAASKRVGKKNPSEILNFNRISPLTFEEIQNALRMNLVKKDGKWTEHYRPYRDIWLLFLQSTGETKLIRKSLPELNIRPIPEVESTSNVQNYSKKNKTHVENLKSLSYQKSYKPEANLIINNTRYIKEIVYDRNFTEEPTPNPFEKVINKEFHYVENNSSVGFDTRLYYEEALKLSNSPEKYVKASQNPILTYVPEKLASEKFSEKFKLQKIYSHQQGTPAENNSFYKEFDLENMTEKMENCGSSIQNLAMSLAFTEKPAHTKNLLFVPQHSKAGKSSKNRSNRSISPQNSYVNKYFATAFRPEDCWTVKQKSAKLEPIIDKFQQPIDHIFRNESVDPKRTLYKLRFKCDPLENPHHMSQFYLKEKEEEIKENKNKIMYEIERKKIDKIIRDKPMWVGYHKKANLIRKEGFIDHKPPQFLQKGQYTEPLDIHISLYRDDTQYNELFRLYHKALKSFEKSKYLGEPIK